MFKTDTVDEWLKERHGKFTASEMGVLMKPGTSGSAKVFSTGAMNYIRAKAVEEMTVLWERPELDEVKSLLHGKVYEEPAFEEYVRVTRNSSMRYFGTYDPIFLEFNKDSGGSPDGMMGEGENIILGLELKCPKNSDVHFDYLQMNGLNAQWMLKDYSIEYYTQMQFLMMIMKAPEFHFFSYDERFTNKKLRGKIIEIKKDEKFCNTLEVRLAMAIKEKNYILKSMV